MAYPRPFSLDFAFALCIIRHKRPEDSFEDFFKELRQHVRSGKRWKNDTHHIDGVEYWKTRYNRVEMENTRYRAQVALLENELARLRPYEKDVIEKDTRRERLRSKGLDTLIDANLALLPNLINTQGKALMDGLCLLHFANTAQESLTAMAVLHRTLYPVLSMVELSQREAEHFELLGRLLLTIYRRSRKRLRASSLEKRAMTRAIFSMLSSVLPLFRLHTIELHERGNTQAEGKMLRDPRPQIISITKAFFSYDENIGKIMFHNLLNCLQECLELAYSDTTEGTTSIAHEIAAYHLHLLASLNTFEDVDSLYEQKLIRMCREMGPIERDIWSLGVLKSWIKFE